MEQASRARVTRAEPRVPTELALATAVPLDDDGLAMIAPAVVRAASELAPRSAPAGILADVAYLLLGPPLRLDLAATRATTGLSSDDPALRSGVMGVFDSLIAPIALSSTLTDIRDALARHPREIAVDTAGVLVAEIVDRVLGDEDSTGPKLAELRKAFARPSEELARAGSAGLRVADRARALSARYEHIARRARRSASPLERADVDVAEAAHHLRHRAARLALRHLAEAHSAIAKLLPAAIIHRRSRGVDVATREHDESTYPMGGFSSMTNSGSLENVVTSELAFSSDGDIAEDLFAIRWAMGELLYYTRDESVAHRRRVAISIVVAPDLGAAGRMKDPEAPFQRLVLALAALSVFAERATAILRHEALSIRIALPGETYAEERALLAIRLTDAVTRGIVDIVPEDFDAMQARAQADEVTANVMRLYVGARAVPQCGAFIQIAERPSLWDLGGKQRVSTEERPSVEGWAEIVKALLVALP